MKTVVTFGCRLNAFESEKIKQFLEQAQADDVLVVNTCAVTAEAERQARQMIRRLKREHPDKKIVVTGCSATVHGQTYEAMPEVEGVVSNRDKDKAAHFVAYSKVSAPRQELINTKKIDINSTQPPKEFESFFSNHSKATHPSFDPKATNLEDRLYEGFLSRTINTIYEVRDGTRFQQNTAVFSARTEERILQDKTKALNRLLKSHQKEATPPIPKPSTKPSSEDDLPVLERFEDRARAFLPIQTGCNNACTFCLIRIARGKSVSFPWPEVKRQAQQFAQEGYHEIDLTGIDITSYNREGLRLGTLIQKLLGCLPQEVHLRLSSLDPAAIDETLEEAFSNPRVLPFAHLSLQSGDATILRRMARRHTPEDLHQLAKRLRQARPDIALGADIIVGFPGETEEMFLNTCHLVEECSISLLHIFPYSDRPGTLANDLKSKVAPEDKKRRAAHLRTVGQAILKQELKKLVGKTLKVLVEQEKEGTFLGKTEHFFPVRMKRSKPKEARTTFHQDFWKISPTVQPFTAHQEIKPGRFYTVRIRGIEEETFHLIGDIVSAI